MSSGESNDDLIDNLKDADYIKVRFKQLVFMCRLKPKPHFNLTDAIG